MQQNATGDDEMTDEKNPDQITQIRLKVGTRDRLNGYGIKSDTYDVILDKLMNAHDELEHLREHQGHHLDAAKDKDKTPGAE